MENFSVENGEMIKTGRSVHAAYMFVISAHDLARFGLLMLRNGNWNRKQVIRRMLYLFILPPGSFIN